MNGFWVAAGGWWVHAAVAGGAVLLVGWVGGRAAGGPARRHRVAAWGVRGAVLAAALCALPSWLVLPVPDWASGEPPPVPRTGMRRVPLPREDDPPGQTERPSMVAMLPPVMEPRRFAPRFDPADMVVVPFDPPVVSDTATDLRPKPMPAADPRPKPTPEPVAAPANPPESAETAPAPAVWEWAVPVLVGGYFAAAGVLLLQLALGHVVLARLVWAAAPLTGKARWVFDRLTEGTGLRPRAFVSAAVPSPVCFGFFRPTILLPKALAESVGEDELRWVLAHELDHVQRGDHRTAYWVGLARAAFFFVPWFWPLRKHLGLNQEFLADAAAAGAGGRPVEYAAFLVNLSATPLERRLARPSLASTGVRAGKSDLFRRVNMLLKWGSGLERRVPRGFAVAAGAGVLAAAVGLSGLGFAADPPQVEEPKQAVPVTVTVDDEKEPPVVKKKEDTSVLKAKIEQAIKDGKVDEARDLLNKLEKAVQANPAPPAKPARVVEPPVPVAPGAPLLRRVPAPPAAQVGQPVAPGAPQPPVVVQAPRGDWAVPAQFNAVPDLRKQYEKQLKEFDKAIQEAKDDDAREQLTKARDEYKKAMEGEVKKADESKAEVDKARKGLNKAMEQNRLQLDMGQKRLLEMHKQLEERLMKEFPKEFEKFGLQFPKELEQMQNFPFQFQQGQFFNVPPGGFQFQGQPFAAAGGRQPRFGASVEKIPPAMVEQLNLDKDSGILIVGVVPGTVADKLGLKKNDVLLRFAGKDIPADPDSFVTMVGNVKGGQKIDVTVLRKGKKETFKDVELPAAQEAKPPEARLGLGGLGGALRVGDGGGFNQMSININDGAATLTANKGDTTYTVAGQIENGKLTADKITVTEGKSTKTYENLNDVPKGHRDAVEKLIGRVRGK